MDLMYLPDSIAYQSRMYDYSREHAWVNINECEKPKREKSQQCGIDQKTCSICKSRQKRVLSNYIMKTRKDSDRETCIEEEEEEGEEPEESHQETKCNTESNTREKRQNDKSSS